VFGRPVDRYAREPVLQVLASLPAPGKRSFTCHSYRYCSFLAFSHRNAYRHTDTNPLAHWIPLTGSLDLLPLKSNARATAMRAAYRFPISDSM
jgi:hypothetical protein